MKKTYRILNLVKKAELYTNQALEQAIVNFNLSQKHIYLDFAHYDIDKFMLLIHNNCLKIAYSEKTLARKYYSHPEDYYGSQYHAELDQVQDNSEIIYFDASNVDLVLTRFGPTFNHNGFALGQAFTQLGVQVSNSINGLRNCRDKWHSYLQLLDIVPVVNSSFMRWDAYRNLSDAYLVYPQITKPNSQSMGGQGLNLAYNQQQLAQQSLSMSNHDFTLAQEYIQSYDLRNYDLRIMVLNGQVTGAFLRVAQEEQIAANIAQGGYGVPYQITPALEEQALAIAQRLELDLCGLDFIYNPDYQQWQFLEANANPGFFAYDKVLKQEFALNILDYLLIRLTGHNSLYFSSDSCKDLSNLHPLNREQALVWQEAYNQELAHQQQAQVDRAIAQATAQRLKEKLTAQGVDNVEQLVASHTGVNVELEPQHPEIVDPQTQVEHNYQKLTADLEPSAQLAQLAQDIAHTAVETGVSISQSRPVLMHQGEEKQAAQELALQTASLQEPVIDQGQAQSQADLFADRLVHDQCLPSLVPLRHAKLVERVHEFISLQEEDLALQEQAARALSMPQVNCALTEAEQETPHIATDAANLVFAPDPSLVSQHVGLQKEQIEKEQREKIQLPKECEEELTVVTFEQEQAKEQLHLPTNVSQAISQAVTNVSEAVTNVLATEPEPAPEIWSFEQNTLPQAVPIFVNPAIALEQTATQPTDAEQFNYADYFAQYSHTGLPTLKAALASAKVAVRQGVVQETVTTPYEQEAQQTSPFNQFPLAPDNPLDLVRLTEKQLHLLKQNMKQKN